MNSHFLNPRNRRDRKRSAHEIAEGIALVKAVEERKKQKRIQKTLKTGKIASWFLLLINVILFIDLFVLNHAVIKSQINKTNVNSSWTHHATKPGFNIFTKSGTFWTVDNSGMEKVGTNISYKQSLLFQIQYEIYNDDLGVRIYRSCDALTMSKYCSIMFLCLAVFRLCSKIGSKNHYLSIAIVLILIIQDLLLMFKHIII